MTELVYEIKLARVQKILKNFSKKKVLVFGDVGIDKYTIGKVSRISPEAPIPIVEVYDTQLKLGLAANVADNVKALGAEPYLVGVVGRDHAAAELKNLLKKNSITASYLVADEGRKTTLKERVVAETQQMVRIDHETQTSIDPKIIKNILHKVSLAMNEVSCVIIEDYAKGLIDASLGRQVIQMAAERRLPVLVDPNVRSQAANYFGCTVLTPNTLEAESISKMAITDLKSLKNAGAKIIDEINAEIVVITRGKEGMAIFLRNQPEPILIPTFAREVFDVSGAGDTVIATLSLALASGADVAEACLIANYAAGIEVAKRGTATVTRTEIVDYIKFLGKHLNAASLKRTAQR